MSWRKIPITLNELCIDTTLRCGQSFRWKKSPADGSYSCAFKGRLISLKQDATHLHYRTIHSKTSARNLLSTSRPSGGRSATVKVENDDEGQATVEFLQHYLNLGPNLEELYEQWSSSDPNFKKKAPKFTGVRILRQDAWEALVGFICSSNNNIARISQMMDKLCIHYGSLVGHIDSNPFYDMPHPRALTDPKVEGHLRELGFGYRARYLYQTAVKIMQEEDGWLDDLRNPESPLQGHKPTFDDADELPPGGRESYRHAHEQLLGLQGVGPKVADCVCLMGLGWGEAVPVDTHVWQIAQRDYKFGKGKHRSLTKATYDAVADHFRGLWGKEAGWAHSVLFTADLKTFAERLTAKVEVKEEFKSEAEIKEEDGKRLVRRTRITAELEPTRLVNGADNEGTLIKSEKAGDMHDPATGSNNLKMEEDIKSEVGSDEATQVSNLEEGVIKEDSEAVPSIERDKTLPRDENARLPFKQEIIIVKHEHRTPIKQESMTTERMLTSPIVKLEKNGTKKETGTPGRGVKDETARHGSLFTAVDGVPVGETSFQAGLRNVVRNNGRVKQEQEVGSLGDVKIKGEESKSPRRKRDDGEEKKPMLEAESLPQRRASKRQRKT